MNVNLAHGNYHLGVWGTLKMYLLNKAHQGETGEGDREQHTAEQLRYSRLLYIHDYCDSFTLFPCMFLACSS